MRILICDDENIYTDELKSFVKNYFSLRHLPAEITIKCNPLDVVNDESVYEIAFLDIQMDSVDGLVARKNIKGAQQQGRRVFHNLVRTLSGRRDGPQRVPFLRKAL